MSNEIEYEEPATKPIRSITIQDEDGDTLRACIDGRKILVTTGEFSVYLNKEDCAAVCDALRNMGAQLRE